jgi:hypothetical protein
MAYLEIRDDTICAKQIEGGKALKDKILSLAPGGADNSGLNQFSAGIRSAAAIPATADHAARRARLSSW